MKTAGYGVELITIFCLECHESFAAPGSGRLTFTEWEWQNIPTTITCADCGAKFRKPAWPTQRVTRKSSTVA